MDRLEARFWSYVDKRGPDECWEWKAGLFNTGYGQFRWNDKKVLTHRVAAFLAGLVDSISAPTDRLGSGFVLHKCDNRKCCNAAHFFVGTFQDNINDMHAKGRAPPNPKLKLTPKEVAEIRTAYIPGIRQVDLAAQYGVRQATISDITRMRTHAKTKEHCVADHRTNSL